MVSAMTGRREQQPHSGGPENVDRRKGFLDIVERLGQGVVAVTLNEAPVTNYSDDGIGVEPDLSTAPRTPRP
jgi:hypothetical protein